MTDSGVSSDDTNRSGFWCDCGETLYFGAHGGAECNDYACIQWVRCPSCDMVGGRYYEFETNRDFTFGCLNATGPSDLFGSNQKEAKNRSVDSGTDRSADGDHDG